MKFERRSSIEWWPASLAVVARRDSQAAAAGQYQAGFVAAQHLLDIDPDNVQRMLDVAYSRYKLAMAGIDPQVNLIAARDTLATLKADGRLPPAFESWVTTVDAALKATPQEAGK